MRRYQSTLLELLILSLGMAVLLAVAVKLCGAHPLTAFKYFIRGALGSRMAWGETLSRTAILALSGLAVALSFRVGLFNIGAEGQFLLGAAAAAFVGLLVLPASTPWPLGIPILLIAGMAAGASWSLIAGFMKHWQGVSEVITTLMLNLVAVWVVKYLVNAPQWLRAPGSNFAKSAYFPSGMQLNGWGGTSFHGGVFLIVPIAVAAYLLIYHTRAGLSLRATGYNPIAARACGIPVSRVSLLIFAGTGALAGLGGAMAVMSAGHLPDELFTDYGYMAIAVALVARLHPLGILPSALFFAVLETGARAMERHTGVPSQIVYVIEGTVILALLVRGLRLPGTRIAATAAAEAS